MTINNNIKYLLAYTVLFALILFVWCIPFILGNDLPFMGGDVITQHYPALVYIGEYIKELVRSIWQGAPALSMYDFSIGMGDDIMATLMVHSANADIGNLLFSLFPVSHSLAVYTVLIVLRLYAAGLMFSYFGVKVLKANKRYILIGTLIYVFCNWTLIYAFFHVSYLLALIYLPLIIVGFDAVLNNKKPYLFIVSVFLMALASFYFMYMQAIFLIFYAFIRVHMLHKENYFKSLIVYGLKSVGFFIVGIMMAAVTFIPLVAAHLTSGREPNINVKSLWHFSFQEYLNIFTTFHSIEIFDTFQNHPAGMSAVVSAIIVLLFVNKQIKYRKHLIAVIVVVLIFMLIPFGSFLLNGFGFYNNRCGFLFSFTFAAVTVLVLPYIISTEAGKQYKRNVAALIGFACILLTAILINPDKTNNMITGFGFVLAIIVILLLPISNQTMRFFKTKEVKVNCIIGFLTINTAFNAFFLRIPFIPANLLGDYLYNILNISEYIEDDSFYREHSHYMSSFHQIANHAMLNRYYGIAGYWSLINSAYQDFSVKLENCQQRNIEWNILGFDDRTALNALAAVKYYITDYASPLFGYNMVGKLDYPDLEKTCFFYENAYALPLGYTYKKSVSADAYDKLDALDKQTVLMQAVVLPSEYHSFDNVDILSLLNKVKIPYVINKPKDITWTNDIFFIHEGDTSSTPAMTINFEGLPNSETYIRVAGVEEVSRNNYSFIVIENNNIKKQVNVNYIYADYIIGNDGRLVNLGYSEAGKSYADFSFYFMEDISINDIEVYCLPMDDYPAWIEALREDVLENIVISTNKVSGDITLEEEKVLVLSMPYSKGWSCKVNGEERLLLKANHMFMGLPLDAGYHSIELTYRTPGLLVGVMVSLFGGLVFVGILTLYKRKGSIDKK